MHSFLFDPDATAMLGFRLVQAGPGVHPLELAMESLLDAASEQDVDGWRTRWCVCGCFA